MNELAPAERTRVPGQVTQLLHRMGAGDADASPELLSLVYGELRALAGKVFARRGGAVTLQPTVLVHDAYLQLVDHDQDWDSRRHFYAVASVAMRFMLNNHARARAAQKRGGSWGRISLSAVQESPMPGGSAGEINLVALDAALSKLTRLSERQGRIVELRYLTGLPVQEVAAILGISTTKVRTEWRTARAFLSRALKKEAP